MVVCRFVFVLSGFGFVCWLGGVWVGFYCDWRLFLGVLIALGFVGFAGSGFSRFLGCAMQFLLLSGVVWWVGVVVCCVWCLVLRWFVWCLFGCFVWFMGVGLHDVRLDVSQLLCVGVWFLGLWLLFVGLVVVICGVWTFGWVVSVLRFGVWWHTVVVVSGFGCWGFTVRPWVLCGFCVVS